MDSAEDWFMKLLMLAQARLLLDALDKQDGPEIEAKTARLFITILEWEAMKAAEG